MDRSLFTPIAGMAFAPVLDPLAVFRTPEVVLVLRPLQPAALALCLALFAAGRLRAIALMTQVAMIWKIELLTAKALAPGRTLHWTNSRTLSRPSCKTLPQGRSNEQQANKIYETRTKRRKVLYEVQGTKIIARYPVFKRSVYRIFRTVLTHNKAPNFFRQGSPQTGELYFTVEKWLTHW